MELEDPEWHQWKVEKYPPILAQPAWPQQYGSDNEPYSSIWCASLASAFEPQFKEGLKLLDYGCGGARFANFMARRLQSFDYVGVEPAEARPMASGVGEHSNIELCTQHMGHDPRVKFGAIGTSVEANALATVDIIIAGSIFTHLSFEHFTEVCTKFKPALKRGAKFVFSVFIRDTYGLHGIGDAHGVSGCRGHVNYTQEMMDTLARELDVSLTVKGTFEGTYKGMFKHYIFVMERHSMP